MTAAVFAVISAFSGAIANLLARRISSFAAPKDYLSVNFALMFLLLLPAAPLFWQLQLSWTSVAVLVMAALIDLAANYFYFRSFESLSAVTASSILSISPLVALLFAPLFQFGQGIGFGAIVGILLVSAGLALLSRGGSSGGAARQDWRKFWLPLTAALLFGVNIYIIKLLFNNAWTNPYTYYLLRAALIAMVWYLVFKPDHRWIKRTTLAFTAGRLVFVIAQWLLLLIALDLGKPAPVKALTDASPLFVVILSGVIIKERINRRQALGAVVVLAGMVLIALIPG